MGAGLGRSLRWLWLVIPICLTVLWLGVGTRTGASVDAPESAMAETKAFMPLVSGFPPPRVELQQFAKGFDTDTITDIANAGDERLFVVQREGLIRIVWPDGTIEPTPFLDISKDVTSDMNWEQGLLGLAFHPDFPNTPYFYVTYTDIAALRVARVTVDSLNGNPASANSMRFLMVIRKPEWATNPARSTMRVI